MSQFQPNGLLSLANARVPNPLPIQNLGLASARMSTLQPAPIGLGLLARSMLTQHAPNLASGLASVPVAPVLATASMWIYVTERFKAFQENLSLTSNFHESERRPG